MVNYTNEARALDYPIPAERYQEPDPGEGLFILFYAPEIGMKEKFDFSTDVLTLKSGRERRASRRYLPRIKYDFTLEVFDDSTRSKLDNKLYGSLDTPIMLPLWLQETPTANAIIEGQRTVTLTDADNIDVSEGHYILVYDTEDNYSVFIVQSVAANIITTTSAALKEFPEGTSVMPLRTCNTGQNVTSSRYQVNGQTYTFNLTTTDIMTNIADETGWNTYDGALLLDGPNMMTDQKFKKNFFNAIEIVDNTSGVPKYYSDYTVSNVISTKAFKVTGIEDIWTLRKLMYALRGKQKAFWLPNFDKNFELYSDITNGDSIISIADCGYTKYISGTIGTKAIRINKTDGTSVIRKVLSSDVREGFEQLSLDSAITEDIPITSVANMEFLEKVRSDTDSMSLKYENNIEAKLLLTTRTVIE